MLRTFAKSLLWLTVTAWLSPHTAYAQRPHVEVPHVEHAPVPHVQHAPTPRATHVEHGEHGEHGEAAEHASSARTDHFGKGPFLTVAQRIDANPQLVALLTPLLPAGMTLDQAAAGFRNQGQFIAALHVSQNLKIPFATLKAEMVGNDHDSLGGAIRDVAPTADAKVEARKAETEAKADIKATRPPEPTLAQRIDANAQLVAKLTPLLPAGMTLDQAADGFKNQALFIATLHASKDLNIPFATLKAEMVGADHDGLRGAIRDVAPTVDAKVQAAKAEAEARADIKATRPADADKDDVVKSTTAVSTAGAATSDLK